MAWGGREVSGTPKPSTPRAAAKWGDWRKDGSKDSKEGTPKAEVKESTPKEKKRAKPKVKKVKNLFPEAQEDAPPADSPTAA